MTGDTSNINRSHSITKPYFYECLNSITYFIKGAVFEFPPISTNAIQIIYMQLIIRTAELEIKYRSNFSIGTSLNRGVWNIAAGNPNTRK